MSEDEKQANPSYITTGGYLKTIPYQEAARKAWNNATQDQKLATLQITNFDNDIFKQIFGIDAKIELGV